MIPNSRATLKTWCLQKLGEPVIQVNIADVQADDRIDESLRFFANYHYDGVETVYFKHKITATKLKTVARTGTFAPGELLTGGTSGATAKFVRYNPDTPTTLEILSVSGTFAQSEVVTGETGTATLDTTINTFFTQGDIDRGWIELDEKILSVVKVLGTNSFGGSVFSMKFQYALSSMPSLTGFDMITYDLYQKHIGLLDMMLVGEKPMRFNQKTRKLYLDSNWTEFVPDQYLIIECTAFIDPAVYVSIYSDLFLQDYTLALFEEQWGTNLTKYVNTELPGGHTLNGQGILDRATIKLEKLRQDAETKFRAPPMMMIG